MRLLSGNKSACNFKIINCNLSLRSIVAMLGLVFLLFSPNIALSKEGINSSQIKQVDNNQKQNKTPTKRFDTSLFEKARDRAFEVTDLYNTNKNDLDSLVEYLDYEPKAAFEYLRDDIGFDPYKGKLRGWKGVLAAKAGNSLDRSLLLKELLEHMGVDARLVFGTLAEEAVKNIVKRSLVQPARQSTWKSLASISGLGKEALKKFNTRNIRDFNLINSAIKLNASKSLKSNISQKVSHIWVQARLENKWVDLDSSFTDSHIGRKYGEVLNISQQEQQEDIHTVTIEVLMETLVKDNLTEKTILKKTLDASNAARSQIYLYFSSKEGSASAGVLNKLVNIDNHQYQPYLVVDGDITKGSFTPSLSNKVKKLSSAETFFQQKTGGHEITAMYMDIKINSPMFEAKTKRRVLFDRKQAQHKLKKTISSDDLQPFQQGINMPTVLEGFHQVIVNNGGVGNFEIASTLALSLEYANTQFTSHDSVKKLLPAEAMWPQGNYNLAWLNVGEKAVLDALNDRKNIRYYVGESHITILSTRPILLGKQVGVLKQIDLLHDEISFVATTEITSDDIALGRMRYGILRSSLETTIGEAWSDATNAEKRISASTQLKAPLVMLGVSDIKDFPTSPPSLLIEDIRSGAIVIVSKAYKNNPLTWWKINPKNGNTTARLASGLGGYHGLNHVNSMPPTTIYEVDPKTMNTVRKYDIKTGKIKSMNKRSSRSGGGSEYLTILSNISIPLSVTVGQATGVIVAELFIIVLISSR